MSLLGLRLPCLEGQIFALTDFANPELYVFPARGLEIPNQDCMLNRDSQDSLWICESQAREGVRCSRCLNRAVSGDDKGGRKDDRVGAETIGEEKWVAVNS